MLLQILDQPAVFAHLSQRYKAAKYKIDTYHLFLEKAINLAKDGCPVGFITPNSFLRNKHALELRRLLLASSEIDILRVFYYPVFHGASVDTCVIVLRKRLNPSDAHLVAVVRSRTTNDSIVEELQTQSTWDLHREKQFTLPGSAGTQELIERLDRTTVRLGEFATAYFGIQTFDRTWFVTKSPLRGYHKPCIDGGNILRYALSPPTEYVDFRPESIKSGGKEFVYEQERIGVRQIGASPIATMLPGGIYSLNTIYNIFFTKPTQYALEFVLGVISSRALRYYWNHCFFDQKETFPKIKKDALLAIPIPKIDFADRQGHDRVVELVDRMLSLREQASKQITPHDKTSLQSQIAATDRQIDQLVYELYGLTDEEIKIVEGTTEERRE